MEVTAQTIQQLREDWTRLYELTLKLEEAEGQEAYGALDRVMTLFDHLSRLVMRQRNQIAVLETMVTTSAATGTIDNPVIVDE